MLTAVLIKRTWVAMDREGKLNTGIGKNAKGIENVVIYSTARKLMPKLRAASPGQALLIELLLLWFDEMMRRLFAGEAVRGGGRRALFPAGQEEGGPGPRDVHLRRAPRGAAQPRS
ncbi:MAG: hypothetical protein IPN01_22045 [Deltaproteobacteria bacterium]|nr:hypothetical protein [Deltaproteobacteria bacterium]